MRIEKIHIKGFRNFEDEEIFFQPKTLIIGANDVGKTNLLYALRILFDKSISEHDLDLKDSDYNAYCNTDTVEITATICDVTEECLLSTFGGAVKDGVVLIRYSNSKNGQYSIWMGYDENVLTEYSTRQYIKRLNMQYVDTNRDLFKFLKHERLQILHISKELLKEEQKLADEENTKEIQNKLNEINNQISSLNYVASALENVNIELSELSVDNEDQKIRFIAGESDAGKLLDNLTLSFSTGDNLLSIGGDGRNNQIFLATWIAKQNIQKNVDHVTFYAIEEPEAHLHPHQQRKLSTYIQEKFGEQVFITTHSPHIASKFNPANIVRLYTIKKKTYAACSGCSDFMKVAFQDFGYRLNALSAECFFVNGVFLVEGVSEVLFYTALTINQNTLSLMRSLFITRNADVDAEKPVFSPLIEKLKDEHKVVSDGKYDDTNDAIISIFNKLVETYPEEPHFTAHLARFYFYIDKNYDKGFANIDAAIALSESTYGYVDPLLYHMKAMGYSSRISNKYIKDLVRAINDNSEKEKINLINQIENDAQEAFKLYELVRKSNVGIAGHVSEIYMCINVANAIKRVLEESGESFSNYLLQSDGDWVMKYVDRATDLWEEVKKIAPETNSEELEQLEIRIKQLTSDLEGTISLWEDYVNSDTTIDKTQARRILAHAYIKQMENGSKKDEQDVLKKIIKLMEDNMVVESQHTGNIRLWFDAICKYKVENQETLIMDAINKLNRWISLTDSVEAHYYRFVLKFIQAINGSILAESELPKLLRELKQKSMNLYNRTVPQHWLVNEGTGLSMLYSNSRSKKNAISEEEMAKKMRLIVGRISNNYVNESHAYINYHGTEIYFNPSATKGEIDKSKINQRVKFGIGFSYDGPRAYNSSIQLMGKEDVEEVRNIETGMIIKCEVIKNVAFFTQVRLVGYSEEVGSIHIDELSNPFNRNHRPSIGSVFEVKVLNQKFDNKTQRNIWMLTMNVSGSSDEEREETAMAKALKNIKL